MRAGAVILCSASNFALQNIVPISSARVDFERKPFSLPSTYLPTVLILKVTELLEARDLVYPSLALTFDDSLITHGFIKVSLRTLPSLLRLTRFVARRLGYTCPTNMFIDQGADSNFEIVLLCLFAILVLPSLSFIIANTFAVAKLSISILEC